MTTVLTAGMTHSALQNVVYALPAVPLTVLSNVILQWSPTFSGTFADFVGSNVNPGASMKGGFVKAATGIATVRVDEVKTLKKPPTASGYTGLVIADGAVAFWKLDETTGTVARDSIGTAHGTISGGVTLGQIGPIDKCMKFDGSTGKIVTTQNMRVIPPFTIEAWVRTLFIDDDNIIFETRSYSATEDEYLYRTANQNLQVYIIYSGPVVGSVQTPMPSDGQWHHTAATYSGGLTFQLYVDGVRNEVGPLTKALVGSAIGFPISIGYRQETNASFHGEIDNVAIYNKALTPAQILAHYNARDNTPYHQVVLADKPSNYWRLNDANNPIMDIVGGASGTAQVGVTPGQPGALSNDFAASFNGTTGSIATSNVVIPVVVTVEAWINIASAVGDANAGIVSTRDTFEPDRFIVGVYNKCLYIHNKTTGGFGSVVVANGAWRHVVAVLDGVDCKFYIDGVFSEVRAFTRTVQTNLPIKIGFDLEAQAYCNGSIDEVAIYPYALSPTQIARHYRARR